MRIGILTHFHNSINYGGVLQAYALCKYLNNIGYSAFQIQYHQKTQNINSESVDVKEFLRKANTRIKRKILKRKNKQIRSRMEENFRFFRNNIPHTYGIY